MIEALFNFIIQAFFWLLGVIGSLIIYPLQLIIVSIFPTLGQYIGVTINFFKETLFPMVSFVKDFVLIMTCVPRDVYLVFIGVVIARWTIGPAVRSIRFLINMWKVWKGSV